MWDKVIIGIDPGTNVMGYGVLGILRGKPSVVAMGVLRLNRMEDHYMRLHRIHERVLGACGAISARRVRHRGSVFRQKCAIHA